MTRVSIPVWPRGQQGRICWAGGRLYVFGGGVREDAGWHSVGFGDSAGQAGSMSLDSIRQPSSHSLAAPPSLPLLAGGCRNPTSSWLLFILDKSQRGSGFLERPHSTRGRRERRGGGRRALRSQSLEHCPVVGNQREYLASYSNLAHVQHLGLPCVRSSPLDLLFRAPVMRACLPLGDTYCPSFPECSLHSPTTVTSFCSEWLPPAPSHL